jgi:glycine betaine/choline ABC-type transport system substrate-binding protein
MRSIRRAALGATLLALFVGACSSGGSSPTPSASAPATPAPSEGAASPTGATLASTLVLGGPPECPQRPFCAVGLEETYGLTFKEFKPLDAGGPITVEAVKNGQVDVGLLFTSDPSIAANGFVLLADDKLLQRAENLVPVVRQSILDASPGVADLLNGWTAKITQEVLNDLNKQVAVDQEDPKNVAQAWLAANGLTTGTIGSGKTVTVGETNFYEQEVLGEVYAQVLEANGFAVNRKANIGNREIVFPALEAGELDIVVEYAASLLEYLNGGAGEATNDAATTVAKLKEELASKGLTALDAAPASDQNGFVVTKATADKYGLTKLSDLAQPAP